MSCNGQIPSQTTDTTSMNSMQASELEDAESVYNHQASSEFHSSLESQRLGRTDTGISDPFLESHSNHHHGKPSGAGFHLTQPDKGREYNDAKIIYEPWENLDFTSWKDVLENCAPGVEYVQYQQPFSLKQHDTMGQIFDNSFLKDQEFEDQSPSQEEWQADSESHLTLEGKSIYSSAMREHLFVGSLAEGGLEKLDSFNCWMSKELGDVSESHMQPSSRAYWDAVEGQNEVDVSTIPSQGQLDTCLSFLALLIFHQIGRM
ncbi:hypothetical protein PTKIN_Ptkin07bG0237500 [Pterospermum kingtungense]